MQHWELLPAQAALNVRVGSIGGGSLGFPEFPKWLGNYSRENKRRRLLGELTTHLNASVSGGTEVSRGPPNTMASWRPRSRKCERLQRVFFVHAHSFSASWFVLLRSSRVSASGFAVEQWPKTGTPGGLPAETGYPNICLYKRHPDACLRSFPESTRIADFVSRAYDWPFTVVVHDG